jgi:hypothetical protein
MKYILALSLIPTFLFSEFYDAKVFIYDDYGTIIHVNGHIYQVIEMEHLETCPCHIMHIEK